MKLHFRFLALFLVLCMSFPLFATSEEIQEIGIPSNTDQAQLAELLLEVAFTAGDVEYEIKRSNNDFIVYITDEDMSETLFINMLFGTDESDAAVADLIQRTVDWLSETYTDLLELGADDLNVLCLWVHSFDEPDFVYFAVCNGKLVYDWCASR